MRSTFFLLPMLCLGCATSAASGSQPVAPPAHTGPFVSQTLAITDRTANGFTAEVTLVLENPGPGTMRIRTADYTLALSGTTLVKGDVILDGTAESGERQGVVVPIKVKLGSQADELGAGEVNVRATGTLHISHRGPLDLPFSVMLDVPGESLISR